MPRPSTLRQLLPPGPAAAVVLAAGTIAAAEVARACTCNVPPPLATEFAAASVVFSGRALGSRTAAPEFPDHHWESVLVDAVWKGPVTPTMEVLVPDSDGLCGFHFVPGEERLVFALPWDAGTDFTSICSRTGVYGAQDPIWSELGPPLTTPTRGGTWGGLKASYHR